MEGAKMETSIKRCSRCRQEKPISEFYKNKSERSGYSSNCISCHREQELQSHTRIKNGVRYCRNCKQDKKRSEFNKIGKRYSYICKSCANGIAPQPSEPIATPPPVIQIKNTMVTLPTHYNGFDFRSRLEARWAVAFGQIELLFEYEIDGFEFSDGTRYLPDFFLPEFNIWAEVKPTVFSVAEFKKCLMLADHSGYPCVLLAGSPNMTAYFIYTNMHLSQAWQNYQSNVGFHPAHEIFGVTLDAWQAAVYASRAARFGVYE